MKSKSPIITDGRGPKNRRPSSPGEILLEEFLTPLRMTQTELAKRMGLQHVQPVNLIINDRRAVTADTALQLARALKTSPEFWMNLQTHCDLWDARQRVRA